MIVELTFLTGRYHATPWGRHVNEAVPEWPPSPFRLLRALLDAWYRKHPEIPEPVVDRLLRALSTPPRFALPRARASHTRSYLSQNKPDPTDKKLVFDGFAVLERGDPVLVGWPGAVLDPEALDAARVLFGALGYLGRSESWVKAKVVDDRDVAWNCLPLDGDTVPFHQETVPVAGVSPPDLFEQRGFEAPRKGKKGKTVRLTWLDALTWGAAEAIENTMNRPPALEPLLYLRDRGALDARPRPIRRPLARPVEVVRFAIDARVRVPITDALLVGELVRRNLMGAMRAVLGHDRLPPTFSGKDAEGRPTRGHAHVSILSLDEDQDGYIDTSLLVGSRPFTLDEQRAIDRLRPVPRRNGHTLVLTPIRYGTREELLVHSTVVTSATPFAPPRHWRFKRDGEFQPWLAEQVRAECAHRGLQAPTSVELVAAPKGRHRRARWLDFRRGRKLGGQQPAYGLRLKFADPVTAPFSLGYGSHFGLGCFVAG